MNMLIYTNPIIPEEASQQEPTYPWIDYDADFPASERAAAILDWINTLNLRPKTGRCGEVPTHDSIQWGPRQAYVACVVQTSAFNQADPSR
jgi:hypothetical protein